MIKAKINLLGKSWEVFVRSDRVHKKRFKKCHAIAHLNERKIHVRKSSLDILTITHEIVHAFQWELSFYELALDRDQTTEWFCELISKHGEQIIKDAKELCQKLS